MLIHTTYIVSNYEVFNCKIPTPKKLKLLQAVFFKMAFLISNPKALPIGGGTAFPISLCLSRIVPANLKLSLKPWLLAYSLTLSSLFCSGWTTWPCLPSGSGSVMVVLKIPSHGTLPYTPCQLLCLSAVWGRDQDIMVSLCLSSASQKCILFLLESEQLQTPREPSGFLYG